MATKRYDLCVIGSGPAGQRCAIQAAKLGKRVCIVEQREVVGGVAVNTGTIPSKALREAILRALGRGSVAVRTDDFTNGKGVTFAKLLDSSNEVVKSEIDLCRRHLDSNGIEIITGVAQFRDANTVDAVGVHATTTIAADHFLIAVGTTPSRPKSIPFDNVNVVTSDEVLHMPHLPRSMIVVGGGVIGTEYASMLQSLGVRVTLVEGRPRLLDFVDAEITEALQYHLRQSGMTLRMGEKVVSIRYEKGDRNPLTRGDEFAEAFLESGKTLRADSLLYAVGRQGATAELNLGAAGLSADDRGRVRVDESFRTTVKHIFAAGDVIGFPALASTSMEQGRLAACAMFGERCDTNPAPLPYGIYSIPEISMVGWTEERLTAEGIPYEAGIAQYKEIARGQLVGDEIGILKLLIHQETRTILGVHALGTGATELIHIGQTAMAFNATVDYFVNTVFNYPTLAECYKVAAFNAVNKLRNM
ncbi:MAG: Si-specific NAD(P)(+) transhydrogenase [Phycisphaerales bacterium]|nr:MAG: Si-specific NAD(P)(+) transhydrogenase [Phycisphaerales bacterium]